MNTNLAERTEMDILLPVEEKNEAEIVMDFLGTLNEKGKDKFLMMLRMGTVLQQIGNDKIGA